MANNSHRKRGGAFNLDDDSNEESDHDVQFVTPYYDGANMPEPLDLSKLCLDGEDDSEDGDQDSADRDRAIETRGRSCSRSVHDLEAQSKLTVQQSEHAILLDSFESSSQSLAQLPLHPAIKAAFAEYTSTLHTSSAAQGREGGARDSSRDGGTPVPNLAQAQTLYDCVPVDRESVYLAPCVSNHMKVDEKLRRAHTLYLYEEVQVGVRELALPHVQVEYHALQQHLDNIAQESAAQAHITRWFKRSHQFVYDHIAYGTSPSREIKNNHAAAGTDTCCVEALQINKDGTSSNTTSTSSKASAGDATGAGAAVVGGARVDGGADGAGGAGAGTPSENATEAPITLKVRDQSGEEMFFKEKEGTAKQIMDESVDRKGVSLEVLRFTIDGTRVNAEDTPKMLEMEDGDQIDVLLQQLGDVDEAGGTAGATEEVNVPQRVGNAHDASSAGHAQTHIPTATHMSSSTAASTIDPSAPSSQQCLRLNLPREGTEEELRKRLSDYDTTRTPPTTQCPSTSPTPATSSAPVTTSVPAVEAAQLIPQLSSSSSPPAAHEGHLSPSQIHRSRSASGTEGDVSEEEEEEEEEGSKNEDTEGGHDEDLTLKAPISPLPVPAADPEETDNSVKLRGYCQVLGLDTSGTDRELLQRLQAHALARHALASQEHQPHSQVNEGGEGEVSDSDVEEEEEVEEEEKEEEEEEEEEEEKEEEEEEEEEKDLSHEFILRNDASPLVMIPVKTTSPYFWNNSRSRTVIEFCTEGLRACFPCKGHHMRCVRGELSLVCGDCGDSLPMGELGKNRKAEKSVSHKLAFNLQALEDSFYKHQSAVHGRGPAPCNGTFTRTVLSCPLSLSLTDFAKLLDDAFVLRSIGRFDRTVEVVLRGDGKLHCRCPHCCIEWPIRWHAIVRDYLGHICADGGPALPDADPLVQAYNRAMGTLVYMTTTLAETKYQFWPSLRAVYCGLCAALGMPNSMHLLGDCEEELEEAFQQKVMGQNGWLTCEEHNEYNHYYDQISHIAKVAEVNWKLWNRPNMLGQKRKHRMVHTAMMPKEWKSEVARFPPLPPYQLDGKIGTTSILCGCCEPESEILVEFTQSKKEKKGKKAYLKLNMRNFERHLDDKHGLEQQLKKAQEAFDDRDRKYRSTEATSMDLGYNLRRKGRRKGAKSVTVTDVHTTSVAAPGTSVTFEDFYTAEDQDQFEDDREEDVDMAVANGMTLEEFYASEVFLLTNLRSEVGSNLVALWIIEPSTELPYHATAPILNLSRYSCPELVEEYPLPFDTSEPTSASRKLHCTVQQDSPLNMGRGEMTLELFINADVLPVKPASEPRTLAQQMAADGTVVWSVIIEPSEDITLNMGDEQIRCGTMPSAGNAHIAVCIDCSHSAVNSADSQLVQEPVQVLLAVEDMSAAAALTPPVLQQSGVTPSSLVFAADMGITQVRVWNKVRTLNDLRDLRHRSLVEILNRKVPERGEAELPPREKAASAGAVKLLQGGTPLKSALSVSTTASVASPGVASSSPIECADAEFAARTEQWVEQQPVSGRGAGVRV